MAKTKLLVGTDPEMMLCDPKTGYLKSAIGVIHGNKEKKLDLGNGGKAFPDNVNVEVNINPADSDAALVATIKDCLYRLSKAVYPYQLELRASGEYPKSECQHPDALVFGCEPEFDAYEMAMVQAPSCETTFRSAGGHIHLGFADQVYPLTAPEDQDEGQARPWGRVWVVRMMDLFVGIPSLWMDQDPTSAARRKLYGNAGTHRPKDYGVEYRATGNFWLRSPALVQLIYRLSKFTVDFVAEKKHLELWKDEQTCTAYKVEDLKNAINNSDKKLGKTFLNGLVKKYMPAKLYEELLLACEPINGKRHCTATWTDLATAWGF
jgi:hypothetical protein